MEEEQTDASGQASGSVPEEQLLPKDEPQPRRKEEIKDEEVTLKSEPAAVETKEEPSEQDVAEQDSDALRQELQRSRDEFPPHDSEDSFGPEHVADELRRLVAEHPQMTGSVSPRESREGATAPDAAWENHGPYAPQRSRRYRGRTVSPDPFMFHTTIWLEHDPGASARAHNERIEQLRARVRTMEANLETLRTRLAQVADLQIEECASVHTLREFMTKILRLESMVCGEQGRIVGEAIRACNTRLDNHKATMDDFYARIRIQDWYRDLSEQEDDEETQQSTTRTEGRDANAENQPGVENRPLGRRRIRGQAPQRRFQRTTPRPPPPSQAQSSDEATTLTHDVIQQGMQRLFVAYNQRVTRVAQTDDRLEQFRSAIRRDAPEFTLNAQRTSQDLQHQGQSVERIKRTLFDEVQGKVNPLGRKDTNVG